VLAAVFGTAKNSPLEAALVDNDRGFRIYLNEAQAARSSRRGRTWRLASWRRRRPRRRMPRIWKRASAHLVISQAVQLLSTCFMSPRFLPRADSDRLWVPAETATYVPDMATLIKLVRLLAVQAAAEQRQPLSAPA
jgi:hypothetical protein